MDTFLKSKLRLLNWKEGDDFLQPWAALMEEYKVALYVCLNRTDDSIYSDHGYLDTLEIPLEQP